MAGGAGVECFLCPGRGSIWVAPCPEPYDGLCSAITETFVALPHIKTATLTPDIDEPDEIRTSQTAGLKVSPCPGAVSFDVDVEAVLCCDDWLWCYLFEIVNLAAPGPTGIECPLGGTSPQYMDFSRPITQFFLFNPDTSCEDPGGLQALSHLMLGRAEVGDFGFDNDDTAPTETSFTIKVIDGPWAPTCTVIGGNGVPSSPPGTPLVNPNM